MSEHILDQLLDYLEGRLSFEEEDAIRSHLESCDSCRLEVNWAMEVRTDLQAHHLRHITPERIVELAETGDSARSDDEDAHLRLCLLCSEDLQWAVSAAVSPAVDDGAPSHEGSADGSQRREQPKRRGSRTAWFAIPAALAASLAAFLFWPGDDSSLPDLARVSPVDVRVSRTPGASGSFEETRSLALEAYVEARYEEARTHLESALAMRDSDPETRLLLGSVMLLSGQTDNAIQAFRRVKESTDDPRFLAEASWQLANAHLLANQRREAETALDEVVDLGRSHVTAAEELLDAIRNP